MAGKDSFNSGKWQVVGKGETVAEEGDNRLLFKEMGEGEVAMRRQRAKSRERKGERKVSLGVVVIVKNEERFIKSCLESVKGWADEIVVADSGSTDKTTTIAKRLGAKVYEAPKGGNFSTWRNSALSHVESEWVFYLDADERTTLVLRKEIDERIGKEEWVAYAVPRRNFILGREMKHGGWAPDYVKRIFRCKSHSGWRGKLHEEPVFKGKLGHLKEAMIHLQPDPLEMRVEKSIKWSRIEAKLLLAAKHPPVTWWRVLRIGLTTLWERLVRRAAFLDGMEGLILAVFQSYHMMMVYVQLWEMQNNSKFPPIRRTGKIKSSKLQFKIQN